MYHKETLLFLVKAQSITHVTELDYGVIFPQDSTFAFYRNAVKQSMMIGSKKFMTDSFFRFILKKFPESNWFTCYVVFVYSVFFGFEPGVYKLFLHMLSTGTNSMMLDFMIFQYIFCYAQCAQAAPPIVQRSLETLRASAARYAKQHSDFFKNVVEEDYFTRQDALCFSMRNLDNQLATISRFFSASPIVCLHVSVFLADFVGDYEISAFFYERALHFLNEKEVAVSDMLFEGFNKFFPEALKREKPTAATEKRLLSFRDNIRGGEKLGVTMNIADPYIKSLTSSFTCPDVSRTPVSSLHRALIWAVVALFVVATLFGLVLAAAQLTLLNGVVEVHEALDRAQSLFEDALQFRASLTFVDFDVSLIADILMATFRPTEAAFLEFVQAHLAPYAGAVSLFPAAFFALKERPLATGCELPACNFTFVYTDLCGFVSYYTRNANQSDWRRMNLDALPNIIGTMRFYADAFLAVYGEQYAAETEVRRSAVVRSGAAFIVGDAVAALVFVAAFLLICRRFFRDLRVIMTTTQPPVLGEIQGRFNKLLHADVPSQGSSLFKPEALFCVALGLLHLGLAAFPAYMCCHVALATPSLTAPSFVAADIQISPLSRLMYENSAHIAFLGHAVDPEAHDADFGSLIDLDWRSAVPADYHRSSAAQPSIVFVALSFLLLFLFLLALWAFSRVLTLFRMTYRTLVFLPISALVHNPMARSVIGGAPVPEREHRQFVDDLARVPSPAFLCVLQTRGDAITDVLGDPASLLGADFGSVRALLAHLGAADPAADVDGFAAGRTNDLAATVNRRGVRITREDAFIVVRENPPAVAAAVREPAALPRQERLVLADVVVVAVRAPRDAAEPLLQAPLVLLDGRDGLQLFFAPAAAADAVAAQLQAFAGAALVHHGGPLYYFAPSATQCRPRLFGVCFEAVRQGLRRLPTEAVYFTKEANILFKGTGSAVFSFSIADQTFQIFC
jgi:hypothetical protein